MGQSFQIKAALDSILTFSHFFFVSRLASSAAKFAPTTQQPVSGLDVDGIFWAKTIGGSLAAVRCGIFSGKNGFLLVCNKTVDASQNYHCPNDRILEHIPGHQLVKAQ